MLRLSEMEEDALKEFFNMGLGMAANSLSQMVHNEVLLSLPRLKVVSCEEASEMLDENQGDELVAVRQNFKGELTGTALLIFPGSESLELVRTLLSDDTPLEVLVELEQETLQDVGNLILNAFLESFTQMMSMSFEFAPAEFLRGSSGFLLDITSHLAEQKQTMLNNSNNDQERAFVLMMDFKTNNSEKKSNGLSGFVVLLFSPRAMTVLKQQLAVILADF